MTQAALSLQIQVRVRQRCDLTPIDAATASRGQHRDSLVAIHDEARRERLLDMEVRLRRYRFACFAILALALASVGSSEVGWWWIAPLAAGLAGFAVADRFMREQRPPGALGRRRLGGPAAAARRRGRRHRRRRQPGPDVVRAAGGHARRPLRAAGDGRRHRLHPRAAPRSRPSASTRAPPADHHQELIAAAALILSTVILSGALVESDRAHRRRSTLDPLTGLFNRNALEQRLAELDGQPCEPGGGPLARVAALRPRPLQAGQRPARPRRRRRGPAGRRLHDARDPARRRLDLPGRRRGDPRRSCRAPATRTRWRSPSACGSAVRERRPVGVAVTRQHRRRRLRAGARRHRRPGRPRRRGALRGQGRRPRPGRRRRLRARRARRVSG